MTVGRPAEPEFVAFLAIDWADQKHAWSLQPAGKGQRERGEVEHSPEAVEAWIGGLTQRFAGGAIAVAVEQSRGALVFMLSKYENLHIYPVPPTMSAGIRKAFYASGDKDDPLDAGVLLEILFKHRERLRRLSPDTEATRRVQNLVEERRHLVDEKTAHNNRMVANLKIYFPQILQVFEKVDTTLVCELLQTWPTLAALQQARPARLRKFMHQHHCRGEEMIQKRLEQIRTAIPAIQDAPVMEAKATAVQVSARLILVLLEGIKDLERRIEEAAAAHPDFFIFDSLPGAGLVMAPRLLGVFGSQRERYANACEVQVCTGIAPIRVSSGQSRRVLFRRGCPKFLRQTFHEWAGHTIAHSEWARAFYLQQRARGKGRHAAIRSLAFKWIRIVFRCWKDRVKYDENLYKASLELRKAPAVLKACGVAAR